VVIDDGLRPIVIGAEADLVETLWQRMWWRLHFGGRVAGEVRHTPLLRYCGSSPKPMTRRTRVTVRLPGASTAPATRISLNTHASKAAARYVSSGVRRASRCCEARIARAVRSYGMR